MLFTVTYCSYSSLYFTRAVCFTRHIYSWPTDYISFKVLMLSRVNSGILTAEPLPILILDWLLIVIYHILWDHTHAPHTQREGYGPGKWKSNIFTVHHFSCWSTRKRWNFNNLQIPSIYTTFDKAWHHYSIFTSHHWHDVRGKRLPYEYSLWCKNGRKLQPNALDAKPLFVGNALLKDTVSNQCSQTCLLTQFRQKPNCS